jgi:hypothetical protein
LETSVRSSFVDKFIVSNLYKTNDSYYTAIYQLRGYSNLQGEKHAIIGKVRVMHSQCERVVLHQLVTYISELYTENRDHTQGIPTIRASSPINITKLCPEAITINHSPLCVFSLVNSLLQSANFLIHTSIVRHNSTSNTIHSNIIMTLLMLGQILTQEESSNGHFWVDVL